MNYDWQVDLKAVNNGVAAFMPPALIEGTAWDILRALQSDQECKLGLDKLGAMVSVRQPELCQWLALLEYRQLIAPAKHEFEEETRAVLTSAGHHLLEGCSSVASDPRNGTTH